MDLSGGGTLLACGAEVGGMVDQIAEGTPPSDAAHQAACPHCQAALDELESLWGEVRDLARQPVAVPARVLDIVMKQIRAERDYRAPVVPLESVVPRLVRHALLTGERGTTQIADSVVAAVVRRAVLDLPGVHPPRTGERLDALVRRLAAQTGVDVDVDVDGHRVTAALAIVVVYGYPIPEVVQAVRDRVVAAIERLAGLEAAAIDITVVDVQARG